MCKSHARWRQRHGSFDGYENRRRREPKREGQTGWIDSVHGYERVGRAGTYKHRLVMEQILGRPLLESESVHHKDGDRANNHPSNLELWSTAQPASQRIEEKVDWAYWLLAMYRPDLLAW